MSTTYALRAFGGAVPFYDTSIYKAAILADTPLAYYRLDELSGTQAFDSSGNGNTATIKGATYAQAGALTNDYDYAMGFTATGGLTLPSSLNLSSYAALSIEFWINLGMGWHHVVEAGDASGVNYYVDGQLTTPSMPASVLLGVDFSFAGTLTTAGTLDEVAVYGYKLTSDQVAIHIARAQGRGATSTYTIQIGGSPVMSIAGSLTIQNTIGKRGQASFTLRSNTTLQLQQYQQVQIYDADGLLKFNGYITQPKIMKPGFQQSLLTQVSCVDQHFLADKRIIAKSYTNMTPAQIAQDIVNTILAKEGVVVGQIVEQWQQAATLYPGTALYPNTNLYPVGPVSATIPDVVFAYCTVAAALDALVKAASTGIPYYWSIDQNKKFWFVPYTSIMNPEFIDGTQIEQMSSPPTVQRQNPTYRNVQYILGGVAQTNTQTETRTGDNNTQAWTMGYELASTPTISINLGNGSGGYLGWAQQSVDVKGATGSQFYWAKGDTTITQDSSGTKLRGTVGSTVYNDLLQVVYTGQYPTVIQSQSDAQISYESSIDGTTGRIEEVETDTTITSLTGGFAKASQLLTRYGQQGIQLQYQRLKGSEQPGQVITVNLPMFGLYQQQMLVESVTSTDQQDGLNIWRRVQAVSGPYDQTWIDFWKKIITPQQQSSNISVGVSQALTLLQQFTASLNLTATLTATVHACPVVGTTLYPSALLFPC